MWAPLFTSSATWTAGTRALPALNANRHAHAPLDTWGLSLVRASRGVNVLERTRIRTRLSQRLSRFSTETRLLWHRSAVRPAAPPTHQRSADRLSRWPLRGCGRSRARRGAAALSHVNSHAAVSVGRRRKRAPARQLHAGLLAGVHRHRRRRERERRPPRITKEGTQRARKDIDATGGRRTHAAPRGQNPRRAPGHNSAGDRETSMREAALTRPGQQDDRRLPPPTRTRATPSPAPRARSRA